MSRLALLIARLQAAPRGRLPAVTGALLLVASLLGCAGTHPARDVADLAPLRLGQETLTLADVDSRVHTPDLLATDQAMRDFVALYTGGVRSDRQRLTMLHRAVTGSGSLGIEYEAGAGGGARDVFYAGSANCLSYASLFVALAREAGLDASYQWLEVRPQWTRMGERIMVRLHVNVSVNLPGGERYMVDIDPLPSRDIAGSREISDRDARALYHSNIAMEALAEGDTGEAWLQAVRALQLSPEIPHLWVNVGAVYRFAGQHREAESSYLYALQLDPWDRSAMNNLVVLYGMEGRQEDRNYWEKRVAVYRDANPYYHAWQGDMAVERGDWQQALDYYREALDLLPEDASLLYATGMIHYQLDQLQQASAYLQRAMETATLRSDQQSYQLQLDQVRREMLAGI
jgi:Flp pilus assembly protein TadD